MKVKDLIKKLKDEGFDNETDICILNISFDAEPSQFFDIIDVSKNEDVDVPCNEIGIIIKRNSI